MMHCHTIVERTFGLDIFTLMSDINKQCHILPFFIPETEEVKVEHVNLNEDKTVIRGILCIKRKLDSRYRVSKSGEEIKSQIFYWTPMFEKDSAFERGLNLVERGLGFPKTGKGLTTLLKMSPKKSKRKNP